MNVPEDPIMLMSFVNMKLRDGDFETLEELCENIGMPESELIKRLSVAGFKYLENIRQFR